MSRLFSVLCPVSAAHTTVSSRRAESTAEIRTHPNYKANCIIPTPVPAPSLSTRHCLPHQTGLLGAGRKSDALRSSAARPKPGPEARGLCGVVTLPAPLSVRPRGRCGRQAGALSSELPQRRSRSRSPSARASRAQGASGGRRRTQDPGTAAPGSRPAPRLLRTDLIAWRSPASPRVLSPPQPGLAEPQRPLAAAAVPSPARAPHPGEAAALQKRRKGRDGDRGGIGWDGEGARDGERSG